MLVSLRVKNFRLLRSVAVSFDDLPTVLVGPNASGKSTVLEVLDFLGRCGTHGLQAAATAHGGIDGIVTAGVTDPIEIGVTWSFQVKGAKEPRSWILEWTVSLARAPNGGVRVMSEGLVDKASGDALIETSNGGRRAVRPAGASAAPVPVADSAVLAFEALVDQTRYAGLWWLKYLFSQVHVIGAFAVAPAWARPDTVQPSPRDSMVVGPKAFLDRQGLGLANVLYNLFTNHRKEWSELEKAFRGEFPFVERLVFPPDAAGSKIAFAFEDERYPGRKLFASEMSDGMVAYLCLLAAVLHPDQVGVLGLDEPDANLHPSALRRLVGLAHRAHPRRRVVVVTHSNALLDELLEPAKSIRIVESSPQGATIRQLDPAALAAWRKDYTLSEMRRTGLLDPSNASYGTRE